MYKWKDINFKGKRKQNRMKSNRTKKVESESFQYEWIESAEIEQPKIVAIFMYFQIFSIIFDIRR